VDFVFELVVQVVLELFGELLLEVGAHGAAGTVRNRVARRAAAATLGALGGVLWGLHLSGGASWPRLLWVALALAAAALVLRTGRPPSPTEGEARRRDLLSLPWHWPAARLSDFVVLNVGIAAGVVVGYRLL
jgi:hypothetical protein